MSKSKMVPKYVVYHKNCPDGMAAAFAAYKLFGEDGAHYVPRVHNDPTPNFAPGSEVYFVDIALTRDAMIALAGRSSKVVVLDHHETAEADLVDLPANVEVIFDMKRSGAQIAWAYFHPGVPEPRVITHIADRDLWKFEIRNTREITEAVMSYEYDLSLYDSLITEPLLYGRLLAVGEALLRQKENQIAILLREARAAEIFVDGKFITFPAVNANFFHRSDLCAALLAKYPDAPFAGAYSDGGDGRRDWSLRSTDERQSVSALALLAGGGGHRNAAGFSEAHDDYFAELLEWSYDVYVATVAKEKADAPMLVVQVEHQRAAILS